MLPRREQDTIDELALAHLRDEVEQELPPPPEEKDPCRTCVVLDGLPVVGTDKYDKLMAIVEKMVQAVGKVVCLEMPKDPATNETRG